MSLIKTSLTSLLVSALTFSVVSAAPAPLSTFKGPVTFSSDAPLEKINGVAKAQGELRVDLDHIDQLEGDVSVEVKSMKTGNEKRDAHMYGGEWLDASKCPKVTYSFKGAEVLDQKTKGDVSSYRLKVKGEFSLHCVKKPMEAVVELKTKGSLAKASTSFTVALKDYNIEGKKGVVGDKVGNTIDVKVSLKSKLKGSK